MKYWVKHLQKALSSPFLYLNIALVVVLYLLLPALELLSQKFQRPLWEIVVVAIVVVYAHYLPFYYLMAGWFQAVEIAPRAMALISPRQAVAYLAEIIARLLKRITLDVPPFFVVAARNDDAIPIWLVSPSAVPYERFPLSCILIE